MKKIEVKLKECCLDCEHFDVSGIRGVSSYQGYGCGDPERVIACGHMMVCGRYNDKREDSGGSFSRWTHGRWMPPVVGKYGCICSVCKKQSDNSFDYCPNCGAKMDLNDETA